MADDVSLHKNVSSFGSTLINGNFIFNNVIFSVAQEELCCCNLFCYSHYDICQRQKILSVSIRFFQCVFPYPYILWRLLSSGTFQCDNVYLFSNAFCIYCALEPVIRMKMLHHVELNRCSVSHCTVTWIHSSSILYVILFKPVYLLCFIEQNCAE